ncbi:MAG: DUF853 family protein [Deltaproteobacteria bacterium]|uniref:DUF853 family protein n=1 Tax=Candidatus Zymogenus saltonus TaxID=2844893 RepID=A0A9D8KFE9_9DELT|nr:DUF853 family protein [Candidatus Zymogenus saltonus]
MSEGNFYLGKEYDPKTDKVTDNQITYDPKDLNTHGVILGMTGSGKTGLSMIMLEEAALQGIPQIIIDPKGEMANLLLTFPDYRPEDYLPWIDPSQIKGGEGGLEEEAKSTAALWKKGHGEWGITPDRIRKLKDTCDFTVFTPGSAAAVPVNVLSSFRIPKGGGGDEERMRDLISGSVSALLSLVGIEADPIKSREHILLSKIWEDCWERGQDLNLEKIITFIADPPMKKVGVFDLETFYPRSERFELAMSLNNIVASPTFEAWRKGPPLSIDLLLRPNGNKPGVSIFYIAHLNEDERQFFVTILLSNLISWMMGQEGTSELRTMVYVDEALGMLPPHPKDPPTKKPIMTLLKQARAFGVGLLLATQNPVDLDYKALTNAGTWFIGRLQTKQDKGRLIEGLSYASKAAPPADVLDDLISGLKKRVFLCHNVHEKAPVLFQTRWAISYLRGPISKGRLKDLPAAYLPDAASVPEKADETTAGETLLPTPPKIEGVPNFFIAPNSDAYPTFANLVPTKETTDEKGFSMVPAIMARAEAKFDVEKKNISQKREIAKVIFPLGEREGGWDEAIGIPTGEDGEGQIRDDLPIPKENVVGFKPIPQWCVKKGILKKISDDFIDHLFIGEKATLFKNSNFDALSEFGEKREDFVERLKGIAEDAVDAEVEKIADKYRTKIDTIEKRIKKEERELNMREMEYSERKREEFLSAGETILGLVLGKRRSGLTTATSKRRMTRKAKGMMESTEAEITEFKEELKQLTYELEAEIDSIKEDALKKTEEIEQVDITLEKNDIYLLDFGILWIPL